ncbi:hypothetical protein AMS68_002644 [Peltaster fructicola]|uniref:UBZ4-type domain-containing protein n=1 Tax=Peltaster fructicola TaxID=286661 RepID=A0A6H0XQU0_9PEZI|nr:hypothetical protein AMS68_002644 [Peltaster fructicola]
MATVSCPICSKAVKPHNINSHLDSSCQSLVEDSSLSALPPPSTTTTEQPATEKKRSTFFTVTPRTTASSQPTNHVTNERSRAGLSLSFNGSPSVKRVAEDDNIDTKPTTPAVKRAKTTTHAPLAERMRPKTLDEVAGQELVGPDGVLRNLIVTDRVPSMILWGGPGTGKTTIARLIAQTAGTRFVEINSTSSGVGECKKLFEEARNEQRLTGRKTIIFCDEIHRFSKSQQDVFLGPVEAGQVVLIGATTENPSFKVVNALLSRCRTFTLAKLTDDDIFSILRRAFEHETGASSTPTASPELGSAPSATHLLALDDFALLHYLASFADGDARTGLNLLDLALDLSRRPGTTADGIKKALTQTLVYDRAGDQHYDTISAFHKSVRGSNADAALYYLARMLQSGEDPLYVARRMVVIASEDVGLADNSMLSLATATYTAAEKIGMPECRINLAHCAVALCEAPKSVRAYRGLNAAYAALKEPGKAGLPVPTHLRNAPTRLMKELGYGKEYKYNPDYKEGRVVQVYLPEKLEGRTFLPRGDLGESIDPEVEELDARLSALSEQDQYLGPDGD